MAKPIFPPDGTRLHKFLDAMLGNVMYLHPEFVQYVGHPGLLGLAAELRSLGWPVKTAEHSVPVAENPNRRVTLFYIGEHTLRAAIGEDIDE